MATVTSYTKTQLDTLLSGKATPAQITTAVANLSKASVGLANVDNTADANKPVSTAQAAAISAAINGLVNGAPGSLDQLNELATALGNDANFAATITNALALKAPLASPTFTGTVAGITKTMIGLSNVDNTADTAKPVSTLQAAADATVQAAAVQRSNHTGTQSVTTITGLAAIATSGAKTDIGLGNVDNTSDANKPISTAQQTALDAKAALASPTFTGTVSGITALMVNADPAGALPIVSSPVIRSWSTFAAPANGSSYNFSPRVRPFEVRRVIRVVNLGTTNVQVAYSTATSNNVSYDSSITSGNWSASIAPGQEWVDTAGRESAVYVRPFTSTDALFVGVYTEAQAA